MRRLSIRWKLTLWYGAVLSAVLAAFGTAVYVVMRNHLLSLTDAALAEELADLGGDVALCRDARDLPRELGVRYSSHEGYEFQVSTLRGAVLFRSGGLGAGILPLPAASAERDSHQSAALPRLGRMRTAARVIPGPGGPLVVQAAVSLRPNDEALRELLLVLCATGPLALAGALGGGSLLARQALAPVDRMAAAAAQITASRLDRRIDAPNEHDELGRLAHTLNDMMARLQRSFDEVRRFTADAAHELRSPLAMLRTEAEVALRTARNPARDAQVLENVLEEVERLTRLVNQLLFLCREDAGLATGAVESVRLDDVVRESADHMRAVAREKGVHLELSEPAPCRVVGNADRLHQLLYNLMDNAIKFTPPGGTIRVRSDAPNGRATVVVADTGVGIPPEHLAHVFDRFYRVDQVRSGESEGTGLGLAICRAIAEAHRGEIRIESDPGRGTRVMLTLPVESLEVRGGMS